MWLIKMQDIETSYQIINNSNLVPKMVGVKIFPPYITTIPMN